MVPDCGPGGGQATLRRTGQVEEEQVNQQQQAWLERQQQLVLLLGTLGSEPEALVLALCQHAQVHAATLAPTGLYSFEDEVLNGLRPEQIRGRPAGESNSIAWLLWHCARIEDVTTNLLIASQPQVLEGEGWLARLNIPRADVGTAMSDEQVAEVTSRIDLAALLAYRQAVGRNTRQMLQALPPERLHRPVAPAAIQQLLRAGVLSQGALDLAEVWGSWKIGDLIKQPAIRHSFLHLNEALEIKEKVIGEESTDG
jgi:hypothetical protein